MDIINFGSYIRLIDYGDPFKFEKDLRVERFQDGKWQLVWEANSLSNDYAYSDAYAVVDSLEKEYGTE